MMVRSFKSLSSALFAACALCLAAGGACASGPGTTAANFLKIPVGARESALAGAFTAVGGTPGAVFYNPAGLALLDSPALDYSYNNYYSGISQHAAAAAWPAARGAWGLGLNYFQVGAFDSYDAQDNPTGKVSAYGAAASLGYGGGFRTGLAFLPELRYGLAGKYLAESLDGSGADGAALDAGLLLSTGLDGLALGAAAENLAASRLDFDGPGARPARKFKAGLSYLAGGRSLTALLSAEAAFPEDGPAYFSAGLENTLYGALALRAGYTSFGDAANGVTFGLGLNLPARFGRGVRLDYSFGSTYDLGNIHKFGLSYRFGKPPAGAAAGAPAAAQPEDPAAKFSSEIEALYGADPEKAAAAAESLAADCGPRVLEHFSALLASGRREWKAASLRGLARCSSDRAPLLLAGALRDEDAEVRRLAALALGARGGEVCRRALEEALKTEETEPVKGAILEALLKPAR